MTASHAIPPFGTRSPPLRRGTVPPYPKTEMKTLTYIYKSKEKVFMFKRAQANIRHWIKWYNAEKAATAYERFFATLTVRLVPVSSEPSSARTQSGLFWKLVLEYVVKSDIFCNRKMSNSSLAKEKLSLELTLFSDLSQEEQPSPTMFLKEISLELN